MGQLVLTVIKETQKNPQATVALATKMLVGPGEQK